MELMDYWECLFNEDEAVCFSNTPRGTTVTPLLEAQNEDFIEHAFVSINPLHSDKDMNPTEIWHCERVPRRADHNVVVYRNILVEMDTMPLEKQLDYMNQISFPFSTCVFSGNKSYHFIISLKEPLATRREYNDLVLRIYKAVGLDYIDPTCKNPSRFSRIPGHFREDTEKEQTLISVMGRLSIVDIEAWLLSRGIAPIEENPWEDITYRSLRKKDFSSLSGFTKNFLQTGASLTTGWNIALFKAAADFCRNGWSEEEARDELMKITGILDLTDEKTIRSAFANERNKENYG